MKNLSFYQGRLINSLSFAKKVARQTKGKIATLADIISLRVKNRLGSFVWDVWFTPATTLYFGRYDGKRTIVVAHHFGPLNTISRLEKWSKSGSSDEPGGRKAHGQKGLPKISSEEFGKLVRGEYGEVSLIDFDDYFRDFEHHLSGGFIKRKNSLRDPLLMALFGKDFEAFVKKHFELSSEYAFKEGKDQGSEEKILKLDIKEVYGWGLFPGSKEEFPEGDALAFLLVLARPGFYGNHDLSVSTEVYTSSDLSSARFVVLNDVKEDVVEVSYSPEKHYGKCLVESDELIPQGSCLTLMRMNGNVFVEYPKKGERMDTGEAKFLLTKIKKVGKLTSFKTSLYGSPFLKYGIDEVKAIMPASANAYEIVGEIAPGEIVEVPVQFYNVEADTSRRILRSDEVMKNLPLLLKINGIKL